MSDFIFPGGVVRGGSMHPVAKRRRMQSEAFEKPGKYQEVNLAGKLAAKRKLARERDAVVWLAEVKARRGAK